MASSGFPPNRMPLNFPVISCSIISFRRSGCCPLKFPNGHGEREIPGSMMLSDRRLFKRGITDCASWVHGAPVTSMSQTLKVTVSEIVSRQDEFMRKSIESSGRKQASAWDRVSIVTDRRVVLVDKSTELKNMTSSAWLPMWRNAMNIFDKYLYLEML